MFPQTKQECKLTIRNFRNFKVAVDHMVLDDKIEILEILEKLNSISRNK